MTRPLPHGTYVWQSAPGRWHAAHVDHLYASTVDSYPTEAAAREAAMRLKG